MTNRILRFPDIKERTPIKNRQGLKNWINDPRVAFPPPTQYGPNTIGWPEKVVQDWLDSRPLAVDLDKISDPKAEAAAREAMTEAGVVFHDRDEGAA